HRLARDAPIRLYRPLHQRQQRPPTGQPQVYNPGALAMPASAAAPRRPSRRRRPSSAIPLLLRIRTEGAGDVERVLNSPLALGAAAVRAETPIPDQGVSGFVQHPYCLSPWGDGGGDGGLGVGPPPRPRWTRRRTGD